MKNIFLILVFTMASASAFAQVEKVFTDDRLVYRVSRVHPRFLRLNLSGVQATDTTEALIEVINTGRCDYHPITWHMVDSFLYAVEARRSDELFVSFFLVRYTIPVKKSENEKTDISNIKKSMKTLYYVQILNKHLFSVSERSRGVEKPMYFDFIINEKGLITIAILEIDQNRISVFSKSIAQHEQEQSDNMPLYKRADTWTMIETFSTNIKGSFRIISEDGKYYVVDENGVLYEAKGKHLEIITKHKSEPIALLFDKEAQKNTRYLSVSKLIEGKNVNKLTLKKYAKRLIKN